MRKILSCELNLTPPCGNLLGFQKTDACHRSCTAAVANEVANSMHQRVRTGLVDL